MTREAARQLVAWYLQSRGAGLSEGLNAQGLGGAMVGGAQLYFEHHADTQTLECSALVYRFREDPKPGVIEGFRQEAAEGTDAGGGAVDFEEENKSLFLSRDYTTMPAGSAFEKDLERLMDASQAWGTTVLDRVATRVFGT
ncbi:hypothetical protein LZ198_31560 [Myxococcus sp. K15C18031901]|uniref:hypothetical protein n=1 Tax=Myxococcus dinghuensis TaxID=2906761 RepID=UPI0020A790B3|nr:hypothetical protein [Myxococcus dinghuensis]MCP3103430.1 hypothetical protein [Myxococcus dinghuensis]